MQFETPPIAAVAAAASVDTGAEQRWQEWRARGAKADRQTDKIMTPLLMIVAVAVVVVILGQIV